VRADGRTRVNKLASDRVRYKGYHVFYAKLIYMKFGQALSALKVTGKI
jgi:hypothetical protein